MRFSCHDCSCPQMHGCLGYIRMFENLYIIISICGKSFTLEKFEIPEFESIRNIEVDFVCGSKVVMTIKHTFAIRMTTAAQNLLLKQCQRM